MVQLVSGKKVYLIFSCKFVRVLFAFAFASIRSSPVLRVWCHELGGIVRDVAEVVLLQELHSDRVVQDLGVAVDDHSYDILNSVR